MRRKSIVSGLCIRGALAAVLVAVAVGVEASPAAALPSNCHQSLVEVTCSWGQGTLFTHFTIPAGVSSISVQVAGARGAGPGPSQCDPYCGGRGALVTASETVTPGDVESVGVGGDGQPHAAGGGGGVGVGGKGGSGCNGGGAGSQVQQGNFPFPDPRAFDLVAGGGGGDGCAGSGAQINDPATQGGDAGSVGSAGPNLQDGGGGPPSPPVGIGTGGSGGFGSENSGAPGAPYESANEGDGGLGPCGTDGCGGSGGGGGGDGGAGGGSGGEGAFNGALRVTYAGSGGGGGGGASLADPSGSISLADAPFVTISWAIPPPNIGLKLIRCPRCAVPKLRITVPAPGVISERQASLISHGPRFSARHSRPKPLIKPTTVTVSAAGTIKLNLRLTTAGKRALERRDKLRVTVLITYTPTGGQPVSKTITVTFRRQRH